MKTITVFGATGYTGKLISRQLSSQEKVGWKLQLAGRSEEKLSQLAAELSAVATIARPEQPKTLEYLCQNTDVLINCVGPFTDLGEPVLSQAAKSGTHYLDITNELGFVHEMKRYDALAKASGAALIPACGFEVALSDCVVTQMRENITEEIDQIHILYDIRGQGSSFGTRKSAVRSLGTSWLAYRDRKWIGAIPCREVKRFDNGGSQYGISFPSSETATIPMHTQTNNVFTWMRLTSGARFWAPKVLPVFAWLASKKIGSVFSWLSTIFIAPPDKGMRRNAPFRILVSIDANQKANIKGTGVYDLTAKIAAYAAMEMVQPGFSHSGIFAPSMALDSKAFLQTAISDWGVQITYE